MYRFVTAVSVLLLALPALADFSSGSNGTDLALDCDALMALDPVNCTACDETCTVQIDLALAASLCDCGMDGQFDDPCESDCINPVPRRGLYDASEWAVVYNYTTIDIPAGVTVTFHNHPKGAPVVWLASGDVIIAGTVSLDGADGSNDPGSSYAIPGPGGFSGGIRRLGGSAGFGPGGGGASSIVGIDGGGGGYGAAGTPSEGLGGVIYGTASIVPLIGGSGGGAGCAQTAGGAGAGAILIGSSGAITLESTGRIFATGGLAGPLNGICDAGSGSGGGIRLITNIISGTGILRARGGTATSAGGFGRIRVEATSNMLEDRGDPPFSTGLPGSVFPEATAPSLRVTAVNGKLVPLDPLATVASGDVAFFSDVPVTIDIEALNLPAEAVGMTVNVRIVQAEGGVSTVVPSTPLADDGNGGLAATAEFDFVPVGRWEVQLSFQLP